jgi:hypothetical protein
VRTFQLDGRLKEALCDLGRRLPEVWEAQLLSRAQKKALLRCLIDKVVIQRAVRDSVQTRIVWRGGASTTLEIPIAVGAFRSLSGAEEMERRMVELIEQGLCDSEIAEWLTAEGFRSPRRERVIESTVRNIRLKHGVHIDRHRPSRLRPQGYVAIAQLSQSVGVEQHWIYYQIRSGNIVVNRDPETELYLFPNQPETVEQLKRLKDGEIEIVRH